MTTLLKPPISLKTQSTNEPEKDILLSLIAKAKARRPHLTAHWELDEKSQLSCHWEMEQ
ncbi:MAG TPA: hypothetical protein V6D13_16145 [Halomicronema sp.]